MYIQANKQHELFNRLIIYKHAQTNKHNSTLSIHTNSKIIIKHWAKKRVIPYTGKRNNEPDLYNIQHHMWQVTL